jgi:flagellar basal-body rod modification protein FlgD
MNPMQSHEMAAHLAQFTSLEQMFNMNSHLEAMKNAQAPQRDFQALTFIGKEISADSSQIVRYKDDAGHELRFNLGGDAVEAKIKIKNEAGETVRELSLKDLKKGSNSIRWDGHNEQGQKTNEGEYKFVVEALNSGGKKLAVDTNASGRITGVQFTKKGPLLLIGNQQVYLSDVKKILEPKEQKEAATTPQQPPMMKASAASAPAPTPKAQEVKL